MIIVGDAIEILRKIKTESIDCCVTSPPYYNLTTTGTAYACQYQPNNFSPSSLSGVSVSDKISVISYTPKSASIITGSVTTTVNAGGVVTGTSDTRETTTCYSYLSAKVTYYKYSSKTLAYRSSK